MLHFMTRTGRCSSRSLKIVAGSLLLANRFVPVALIVLAGFLYNSFAFHLTMMPIAIPAPIIATVLWVIVALKYRSLFAPIFRP
jgi:putative oxidoreductase